MLNDVRTVIALDPEAERRPAIVLTEAVRGGGRRRALGRARRAARRVSPRRASSRSAGAANLAAEVVVGRGRARAQRGSRRPSPTIRRSRSSCAAVQEREVDPLTAVDAIVAAVLARGDARDAAGARRPRAPPASGWTGSRGSRPCYSSGTLARPRRAPGVAQGREPAAHRARSRSAAPTTRSRS